MQAQRHDSATASDTARQALDVFRCTNVDRLLRHARGRGLSDRAKLVLAEVANFETAYFSLAYLAELLECSVSSARSAVIELEKAKLLERKHRFREDGGCDRNVLRLVDPPPQDLEGGSPRRFEGLKQEILSQEKAAAARAPASSPPATAEPAAASTLRDSSGSREAASAPPPASAPPSPPPPRVRPLRAVRERAPVPLPPDVERELRARAWNVRGVLSRDSAHARPDVAVAAVRELLRRRNVDIPGAVLTLIMADMLSAALEQTASVDVGEPQPPPPVKPQAEPSPIPSLTPEQQRIADEFRAKYGIAS